MKRLTIIAVFILLLIGLAIGYYVYNKPHIDVKKADADFTVTVDSLAREFQSDLTKANLKYAGKIILFSGKFKNQSVSESNLTTIMISGSETLANCEMDSLHAKNLPGFREDDEITIKGLFVGYDDLLGELQFKKCLLIND